MLADMFWRIGPLAVGPWWYTLGALVATVICQDAFFAILMYWKKPVSTAQDKLLIYTLKHI